MERLITQEERIRRAEEIYNRRRLQNDVKVYTNNKNIKIDSKERYKLLKKMFLQILICLLIYFIFYLIKNSNYIFSENVINKTKEVLNYDINFEQLYNGGKIKFEQFIEKMNLTINNIGENKQKNETENETNEQSENIENVEDNVEENNIENNEQENGGIGGGEDELLQEVSADEQNETIELSQMEIDANEIKENYSFILPLKGTITSRYGPRTPTDIISANHAGIDIAANTGTKFIAAMEGTVTCVSTEGGYGNHVYIQNGDVITLYAHCSKIYVQEGQNISQGEAIGEVGATGNATGPHLHFEVRKESRTVNPEYILSFE